MVLILFLGGCGKPNAANIALRRENQDLRARVEQLELDLAGKSAAITASESSRGTLPTLPQDRLDKLFTVHGLKLGRLTGGARVDPKSPRDDAIKIYATPTDGSGDELKSAGAFVVQAYDLQQPDSPLVGEWNFTTEEARKNWYGDAMLYEFVLTCPLKSQPKHDEITVRVAFTDELTQRRFEAQEIVKLNSK